MKDFRKPKPQLDLSTIESDLQALTVASKTLNTLTDQLTEQVSQIEGVINALNLGLRVSVVVTSHNDEDEPWISYTVRLSYSKNDTKWGFVIEEFDDDERDPLHHRDYKGWTFKDAPRSLRLDVVHKIPDLIKAMVKEAELTAASVTAKLDDAKAIASTLSKPALDGAVRK